ncbi:VCBS repeat-containing protein [Aliifodinibius sp. S!AR15-10]|uniref:FG-GAP repeat domain-containing protein n=1 Tax=Aliifodinibius sp. S!AR15-10 TaxID=2950437 RepID=UPI0028605CB3|nr:VCBS repeat-containing protein [Aliifodinibius sp. S!AR15-10]MDR8390637.1 VCBS repeat-containing protein [Aliifodinibius sp. S!AR15-10]
MGPQLGIIEHNGDKYPVERTPNLPENYYPAEPQISQDEWQYITDYYLASAPEQLETKQDHPPITEDSLFFRARTPNFREQTPPMVSSIRFDPGNQLIYLSDASNSMFYVFDQNLAFKDRYQLSSAISDIRFKNDGQTAGRRELLTTYIGDVNPSDAKSGFIQEVWYEPEVEQGGAGKMLQEDLARPVETQIADFDLDGSDDLLVNEFAHRTGKLFWLSDAWGDSPQMNLLINSSGCIESKIMDYTGNGFPDILALCTQLDQSIYLFKNLGESEFERERLLQFPITAGSSSFKLVDFNGDGHLDILYTSGDNADYSITFKPYHGVYIYLNDGQGNFTQKWFYPINGAYDAIAKDFDKNGNLDIAVISFFANYQEKPEEGFVFFKGDSILDFTPYHPPAANTGRWIAMDVADWNSDGYDDIVLANFSKGPIRVVDRIQDRWFQGPHFLLLENIAGTLE